MPGIRVFDKRQEGGGNGPDTSYEVHLPYGDLANSSPYFSVPASATPHQWGSRVVLEESTPFASKSFEIWLGTTATATVQSNTLVELSIGADGAEVPFLLLGAGFLLTHSTLPMYSWLFDYDIPAGARITARSIALTANQACRVALRLRKGGWGGSEIQSYGLTQQTGVSTVDGTNLTTVTAANTVGAWLQIATLTHDAVELSYTLAGVTSVITATTGVVQIGIGDDGAQEVIYDGIAYFTNTDESIRYPGCPQPLRRPLSAGTKVWMRYQAGSTAAAARPRGAIYVVRS